MDEMDGCHLHSEVEMLGGALWGAYVAHRNRDSFAHIVVVVGSTSDCTIAGGCRDGESNSSMNTWTTKRSQVMLTWRRSRHRNY